MSTSTTRQLLRHKSKSRLPGDEIESRTSAAATYGLFPAPPNERVLPVLPRPGTKTPSFDVAKSVNGNPRPRFPHRSSSRNGLNRNASATASDAGEEWRSVTQRSYYSASSRNTPPGVLMGGPNPDKILYRRCEDEPIHTPGAVQTFGALLGLKYDQFGNLEVCIASENTRNVVGYGPEQLFTVKSFLDVLTEDFRDEFIARVQFTLDDVEANKKETRLDVFRMTLAFPYEPEIRLWCAMHLSPSHERLVICEFEEYADAAYLRDIDAARAAPLVPDHTMESDPTPEEWAKSTTSVSKPLPVLQIVRQRANKGFTSLDLFNAMNQAEKQLSSCDTIQRILDVTLGLVAELTGWHRLMFYRFDAMKNGCVDAELLNPKASKDTFLGLHYPASDIPKQARDLYKINRIRLLMNRDAVTARLVCRNEAEFAKPLDLTHSYLRAMSPIHNKYLANMGVKSTMSISIVINDDLWGLIACHGYGANGVKVSMPIREIVRNIGDSAAVHIERILMKEQIAARRAPAAIPRVAAGSFSDVSAADLLKEVDADYALVCAGDQNRAIGKLDPSGEALAIMFYLQSCGYTTVRSTHNIKADFPGLSHPGGLNTIAGFLFVPLNVGEGHGFVVFFRKAQTKQVAWAGNPNNKVYKAGNEYLDPRTSFKRWTETIVGTSREWTEDQIDTATILGVMYDRFIDIWPQGGSAGNHRLSLIKDASSKVQPSLSILDEYLEAALLYNNDDKTREQLLQAEESSTALMHLVDNLAKLAEADDSLLPAPEPAEPAEIVEKTFNLGSTTSKTLKELQADARMKDLGLSVLIPVQKLPSMVKGDGERFKQLLVYFTKNAFESSISARVEITAVLTQEETTMISISIQDYGAGMTEDELDDVFRDLEEALDEDPAESNFSLSSVVHYITDANGQIRISSDLGKGTTYEIELPFTDATPASASKPRNKRNFLPRKGSSCYPTKPMESLKSSKTENQVLREIVGNLIYPETTSSRRTSVVRGISSTNSSPTYTPVSVNPSRVLKWDPTSAMIMNGMGMSGINSGLSSRKGSGKSAVSIFQDTMSTMGHGSPGQMSPANLRVLVADANPVVLRMLDEKLSMWGHTVDIASDGEECRQRFLQNPSKIDVILMDLEMPLMDGILATKMIRFSEKDLKHQMHSQTRRKQGTTGRVAIIAVSENLDEENSAEYSRNGFDGWLCKPVDLQRLDLVLQGAKNPISRRDALYRPGQWEKGGWFS